MRLSPQEFKSLQKALSDALSFTDLQVVAPRLGVPLDDIAPANASRPLAVLSLIQWAQTRDSIGELIVEARDVNPKNAYLRDLAATAAVAVEVPEALERAVGTDTSAVLLSWKEGLGAVETQVCSIEGIPGGGGTGFLVGPDLVMTNYHVVKPVIDGNVQPGDAKLRFDYKKDREGATVRPGTVVSLNSSEWLLDHSPYSPLDIKPAPGEIPGTEELDYAVLILDEALGGEPIGSPEAGPARGWIPLPATKPTLAAGTLGVILQHPKGKPITIAFDTIIGLTDEQSRTRVHYKMDTDNGSSGSPVFDLQWGLVALHHSGDPDFKRDATYNEGIPIDTIAALLKQRGHDARLGKAA